MNTDLYDQILKDSVVIAFRVTKDFCNSDTVSILNFLKETTKYVHILVSQEGEKQKPHLHGMVTLLKEHYDDSVTVLRNHLKEWGLTQNPPLKIIGNKMLYVRLADDKKQLLKYTLKEGNYKQTGFPAAYLATYHAASVCKESLGLKIRDNEEDLLMKKIDYETFVHRYIKIKVDHTQPLYVSHIKAYINSYRLKSGTSTISNWIEITGLLKYDFE